MLFAAMFAVLLATFVIGLPRRNGWPVPAAICMVGLAALIYFNLRGYTFGGPGISVRRPGVK